MDIVGQRQETTFHGTAQIIYEVNYGTSHYPIYHITEFEITAPYTLRIKFNDNTEQTIDIEPALHGEIYSPLHDLSLFDQVRLDPEVRTLAWPNDADFDPADLHDWPEIKDGFIKHAQKWKTA